jgi:hypothetical protein
MIPASREGLAGVPAGETSSRKTKHEFSETEPLSLYPSNLYTSMCRRVKNIPKPPGGGT